MCSNDLTDLAMPGVVDVFVSEAALQHSNLEIEVTERQALDVEKHGLATLHALRLRGIYIALDDFGTGYSALSYLKNLSVTTVKLDKSLLVGVSGDAQGSAVVKAVIDLSNALGLEVIAEGVETEQQAAFLKAINGTALQGFLIARSQSADDMTAWLSSRRGIVH